MNFSYLSSVLDLYLVNEKNGTLVIEVLNQENFVKIDFSYSTSVLNKTFVKIPKDTFFSNLDTLITKISNNSQLIKNELKNNNNQNSYFVQFSNSRSILFLGFNNEELNKLVGYFSGTEVKSMENQITVSDKELTESYDNTLETNHKKFAFSMGFASYITIFLTAFWLLDILMIALWIFKTLR